MVNLRLRQYFDETLQDLTRILWTKTVYASTSGQLTVYLKITCSITFSKMYIVNNHEDHRTSLSTMCVMYVFARNVNRNVRVKTSQWIQGIDVGV